MSDQRLEDVAKAIKEVWGGPEVPDRIWLPWRAAKDLGADVSRIPEGSVVELNATGVYQLVMEDEDV